LSTQGGGKNSGIPCCIVKKANAARQKEKGEERRRQRLFVEKV